MWLRIKPKAITLGLSLIVWAAPVSVPVWAGVDVNVNVGIPLPPPIVVAAPPAMVFLAEPAVYVAVGVPYDVFFVSGRYYYFHGGYWYWAPGYRGPWVHVVHRSLPPGLQKYKVERLHTFRAREFQRYTAQGPRYKGRHFVAVSGPGHQTRETVGAGGMEPGARKHKGRKD